MLIAHKIELAPDVEQIDYFRRACGTDRFTWNWALAAWNRQYTSGAKPTALGLKKQFNSLKYAEYPWLKEIHRDAHADAFARLGKAWNQFFSNLKAGKQANAPVFKRKGRCADSFYVANDKFTLGEHDVRLPLIGSVMLKESPRFGGKIMGATVIREARRWFLSVQFDVPVSMLMRETRHEVIGIDLNVAEIVCSDGTRYQTPQPLKAMTRRVTIRSRKVSRKVEVIRASLGQKGNAFPRGTRLPQTNNLRKASQMLSATHYRAGCIRRDFQHKTTTDIARKTQAAVVEDLSVKGMTASASGTAKQPGKRVRQKAGLNRAILDIGFYEIRRQLTYKLKRFDRETYVVDRFFPSSKRCSCCGSINKSLALNVRTWQCASCGTAHDRDENAAANLAQWATVPSLREAFAKVTPVSTGENPDHESEPVRNSGQEPSLREVRQRAKLRMFR
ncbi:MAG TPA: transposase [Paraburkholderia sp.]|jgi:putative transposase|uniref:RNA-guided endonuclease InsQ/TnpB family protein n=1 Tax=Paraburkholderia sp. TaxID=1926495 RepID=UPI002DE5A86F|nr:transposase [Paraburkholderia sp.]